MSKKKHIYGVVIFAICLSILFYFSGKSSVDSNGLSNRITLWINNYLLMNEEIDRGIIYEIGIIIRKLAHFVLYLLLATVALIVSGLIIRNKVIALILSLIILLPIPFLDEMVIQASTMSRSVSSLDIMIDFFGIGVAIVINVMYILARYLETRRAT